MALCIVRNCLSFRHKAGIIIHTFPEDETRRAAWLNALDSYHVGFIGHIYGLCNLHFAPEDYSDLTEAKLKSEALPSRNLSLPELPRSDLDEKFLVGSKHRDYKCCACDKVREKNSHMHGFPVTDPERMVLWARFSNLLSWIASTDIRTLPRICCDHFDSLMYVNPEFTRLNWKAVPTLFLPLEMLQGQQEKAVITDAIDRSSEHVYQTLQRAYREGLLPAREVQLCFDLPPAPSALAQTEVASLIKWIRLMDKPKEPDLIEKVKKILSDQMFRKRKICLEEPLRNKKRLQVKKKISELTTDPNLIARLLAESEPLSPYVAVQRAAPVAIAPEASLEPLECEAIAPEASLEPLECEAIAPEASLEPLECEAIAPEAGLEPLEWTLIVPDEASMSSSDPPKIRDSPRQPVCRVCGESGLALMDIFSEEGEQRQLLHKINSTIPVQVHRDDGLPSQLCPGCTERVEAAFQLRERAIRTYIALRLDLLCPTPEAPPEQRGAPGLLAPCTMTVGDLSDADSDDFSLAQEDLAALSIYDPSDNCDSEPDIPDNCDSALGGYAPSDNCDSDPNIPEPRSACDYILLACDSNENDGASEACVLEFRAPSAAREDDSLLSDTEMPVDAVVDLLEPAAAAEVAAENDSPPKSPDYDVILQIALYDEAGEDWTPPDEGDALPGTTELSPGGELVPAGHRPAMFCTCCPHCEKLGTQFYSRTTFQQHQELEHRRKVKYCSLCYVFFDKKSLPGLLDHWLDLHEDLLREDAPPHPDPKVQEEITFVRNALPKYLRPKRFWRQELQCRFCSQIFHRLERDAYVAHVNAEREKRQAYVAQLKAKLALKLASQTCSICNVSFKLKTEYFFHMDHTHGQKRYECQYCNKRYRSQTCFAEHLKAHESKAEILCDLCGRAYYSVRQLRNHKDRIHQRIPCGICGKQVPRVRKFRHLDRMHFEEKKFQCATCFQSFFSAAEMTQHREQHSEEEVECVVCGLRLKKLTSRMSHAALVAHIDKEHKHLATQSLTCPVTCCRTELPSVEALLQHCSGQHTEEQLHPTPAPEGSGIKTLLCTHCNSSFRNMSVYLNHVHNVLEESTESELPLTCNLCKASFPNEQELTSHLEGHPEAYSFWCRHCRQCFVSQLQRTQHEQIKHARFSQCKLCSAVFRMDRTLKKHMFTAHNLDAQSFQPLNCEKCGTILCDKASLRKHMVRQHEREKRNICDQCGKKFQMKKDLHKHIFVHTKSPYYKCDMCDYSCHTSAVLTRHKKLKHNSTILADILCKS